MTDVCSTIGEKFYKRIQSRLHYQNKNWLCVVCGETGSGKSYSAISIAGQIGRIHFVFTPLEFLNLLNNNKLKKGDVIIFDEAGVGMSSRDWYSVQNKLLGTILQTFRNMNLAVIFTVPNLSFIDVQARKLFHCYMETSFLDQEKEEAYLKVFDIQVNNRFNKEYYKHPKFDIDGRIHAMTRLVVNKPSAKILEYYENLKEAYTKKLNADALQELLNPGGKKPKEEKNLDEIKKTIIKKKKKYVKEYNHRKYFDHDLIRSEFGLSHSEAKAIKKYAEQTLE